MPKSLTFILFLPLIIALLAPNFAYGAALAPGSQLGSTTPTNTPQKPSLPDAVQQQAQGLMEQAQNKLKEQAVRALGSAQEAAKSEIQRQAEKQIQTMENTVVSAVKKVVDILKKNIVNLASKIKNYIVELKNKMLDKQLTPEPKSF